MKKFNLRNYFKRVEEEHPILTGLVVNVVSDIIMMTIRNSKYIYEFVMSLFR